MRSSATVGLRFFAFRFIAEFYIGLTWGGRGLYSTPMPKTDFIVGKDNFTDIQVIPHLADQLYGFRQIQSGDIIRYFVLRESTNVDHVCRVTLIQKTGEERFTPRLAFAIRYHPAGGIITLNESDHEIKASVDLSECHENYWKLVSYLKSLKELDIPDEHFSLTQNNTDQIKAALSQRDAETISTLTTLLVEDPTFSLSVADLVELNRRRVRLGEFEEALSAGKKESWWKDFFGNNKWIFGYGLDYRIIRVEQEQADLGGKIFTGTGSKKADYLGATSGDARFTVIVEIKTSETPLLHGSEPQRSGAWSLSKDLADAVTQAQSYAYGWGLDSKKYENAVELMKRKLLTIQPKAIVVIGRLAEVLSDESKASTFELFRESLHGVEVITFDELLERAKFIVEHMQGASS